MQNENFPTEIEEVEAIGLGAIKKLMNVMLHNENLGLYNYMKNEGFLSRFYNFCTQEAHRFANDLVRNKVNPSKDNDDFSEHVALGYMLRYDHWITEEIKNILQEKESVR